MRDTYSKGDIMAWDEAEYNYFMSLDDMTSLLSHDYLYGEFGEDMKRTSKTLLCLKKTLLKNNHNTYNKINNS